MGWLACWLLINHLSFPITVSQVFLLLPAWNHFPLDHNVFHSCPDHTLPALPPVSFCFSHLGRAARIHVGIISLSVGCEPAASGPWLVDSCYSMMSSHQSSVSSCFHEPTLISFLCSSGSPHVHSLEQESCLICQCFPLQSQGSVRKFWTGPVLWKLAFPSLAPHPTHGNWSP